MLSQVVHALFPRKVGHAGVTGVSSGYPAQPLYAPATKSTYVTIGEVYAPRIRWWMAGNDHLNCCVFTGLANAQRAVSPNGEVGFSQNAVPNWYMQWDNGSDAGAITPGVLRTWAQDETQGKSFYGFGVGGPFCRVDPKNPEEIKFALDTFGWVLLGSQLQKAQLNQFRRGRMWKFVKGSEFAENHAPLLVGYTKGYVKVVSWAKGFKASWGWLNETCDEAYTGILPPQQSSKDLLTMEYWVSELTKRNGPL